MHVYIIIALLTFYVKYICEKYLLIRYACVISFVFLSYLKVETGSRYQVNFNQIPGS